MGKRRTHTVEKTGGVWAVLPTVGHCGLSTLLRIDEQKLLPGY